MENDKNDNNKQNDKDEEGNKDNESIEKITYLITEPILNYENFTKNDIIHINYGEVSFKVEETNAGYLKCIALNSGTIQKFNSLSVEGKEHFSNNLISTSEDKLTQELELYVKLGVQYVVMSIIDDPVYEIKYNYLILF
jgi:pyruvate kinase